jgi:hypothetical protein
LSLWGLGLSDGTDALEQPHGKLFLQLWKLLTSKCAPNIGGMASVGVADDNPDAERLYAKLGYRGTGITDVSNYSWVSDDGVVHQETEHDQLLIKDLD